MSVAGGLACDRAQAEALRRVEGGVLQAAVIEGQALALAILQEEFAVVGAGQRLRGDASDLAAVQHAAAEEEAIGRFEM